MKGRRLAGLASVLLLALAGCQGQPLPPVSAPSEHVVTVSPNRGGTIRLAINAPATMRTQAAAAVYGDIDHLTVKLKRKSDNSLVAQDLSVSPNGTTTHVVFNNVTTGVVYYLEIDAFDINGFSIAKTSPTKSTDIDVTTASTINVPVNFPLRDGAGVVLNFAFTTPTYFTATNYLIWLTNAATGAVVYSHKSTTDHPSLSGVADGNYIAWAAAVDDTPNKIMTPIKQLGTVTVAGGAITAPVGGTLNVSFSNAVAQWATNAGWDLIGIGLDAAGAAYGLETSGSHLLKVASAGALPVEVVGNGTSGIGADDGSMAATGSVLTLSAGFPGAAFLDGSGNIFVGDTTNKKLRMVPAATIAGGRYGQASLTAGQLYTVGTESGAFGPRGAGIDAGGTLYWTDNRIVQRKKPDGTQTALPALAAPLSALNGLAVDRSGNVFVSRQNKVFMYVAVDGTYFGTPMTATGSWQELTNLTSASAAFRHLAVEPKGNLYAADSGESSIWCLDAKTGTKYRVVGNASGSGALTDGGTPVDGPVSGAIGIAVGPTGALHFSTSNAIWRVP